MSAEQQELLRGERDRLMEQYREIAYLAGGLAHEIKNPLSTIRLNLGLLAEDFEGVESVREQRALRRIKVLEQETIRLNDILEDFLRYAHVQELELEPSDLNLVLDELIEFQTPQAEQKGIELVTYFGNIPLVNLDRDAFRQAVLNLIINAEHSMPAGGQIVIQTRSAGKSVEVDVIDNGEGMSLETREKIFRPFFSTRKHGSGLGLPTVRKTIRALEGSIRAESELGKGTRFLITLPVAAQSE